MRRAAAWRKDLSVELNRWIEGYGSLEEGVGGRGGRLPGSSRVGHGLVFPARTASLGS
jgi:hypothetical protein